MKTLEKLKKHFYFYLYLIYYFFIDPLATVETGELMVSGEDFAVFELKECPKKIELHFDKHFDHCHTPCDYSDSELDYVIKHKKLIIEWKVVGVRKIKWKIIY